MRKQFLVVRITSGERTLKQWFGGSLPEEISLMDVFADFASGMPYIRLHVFPWSHEILSLRNPGETIDNPLGKIIVEGNAIPHGGKMCHLSTGNKIVLVWSKFNDEDESIDFLFIPVIHGHHRSSVIFQQYQLARMTILVTCVFYRPQCQGSDRPGKT